MLLKLFLTFFMRPCFSYAYSKVFFFWVGGILFFTYGHLFGVFLGLFLGLFLDMWALFLFFFGFFVFGPILSMDKYGHIIYVNCLQCTFKYGHLNIDLTDIICIFGH